MNRNLVLLAVGVLGVLSVALIAIKPFSEEPVRVCSPYWEEIQRLLPKAEAGMTPEESAYLRKLLEKNTHWHNERNQLSTPRGSSGEETSRDPKSETMGRLIE